jgi:ABC-2 type transport system ATP-binding protein
VALPTVVIVMNAMPVVLEGAHKSYGSVEALKDVDVSIAEGEVVAILGPNGAGKTTAINLMLGLRKPTRGRARLFGLDPGDRRARSRCGVMLQESGVLSSLHVRELVGQFRSYYPNPMSVDRAIAMAGLEAEADRKSAKLSGGQRQRRTCCSSTSPPWAWTWSHAARSSQRSARSPRSAARSC